MDISQILIAIGLTLVAGLSTGIGGFISFFTKAGDSRVLAAALGLSAGVMVYVSFMELLPQAMEHMELTMSPVYAKLWSLVAFFGGMALIAAIDWLIPEDENPHEVHSLSELEQANSHHLRRTGIMLALAITIHNFPEGIATFVTALNGVEMALPIVVAIAIHNIPEGIAVSVPIYQSTGSRRKAMTWTVLSGLAEPVGAVLGFFLLKAFLHEAAFGVLFALIAGIMVYIALDELLPTAHEYGDGHKVIWGVVGGMMVMAVSLLLF